MKRKLFGFIIAFVIIFAPYLIVHAAGLVPDCGKIITESDGRRTITEQCNFNSFIELINNVIDFLLFKIAAPLAALALCIAGAQLLFSGGSSEKVTKAKKIIKNVIIGYIIALAAWLIIKTIFVTLGFKGETFLIR